MLRMILDFINKLVCHLLHWMTFLNENLRKDSSKKSHLGKKMVVKK